MAGGCSPPSWLASRSAPGPRSTTSKWHRQGSGAPVFALAPAARRRGHPDRRRADGGRARRDAGLRDPGPDHADRLHPPHPCRLGKDRAGRRGRHRRRRSSPPWRRRRSGSSRADYQQAAVDAGSVISASLFGAIAGSGALLFPRESFVDVDRGVGPRRGREPSGLRGRRSGRYPRARRAGTERGGAARPGPPAGAMDRAGGRASPNCRRRCGRWRKPVCAMSSTFRTRPTARSTSTAWIALWRQTAATTRSPLPPPSTSPTPWLMTT